MPDLTIDDIRWIKKMYYYSWKDTQHQHSLDYPGPIAGPRKAEWTTNLESQGGAKGARHQHQRSHDCEGQWQVQPAQTVPWFCHLRISTIPFSDLAQWVGASLLLDIWKNPGSSPVLLLPDSIGAKSPAIAVMTTVVPVFAPAAGERANY